MSQSNLFGWDLLYKVTEPQIRNNHDVLICLTHWKLIHQAFRCVGVGEDTTPPNQEEQTEILPEGWNAGNKYSLRYVYEGKLYLLNAIINDSNIIINMSRVVDNHTSGTCLDVNVVKEIHGPLNRLIPNYEEIILKIKKELIDPMLEVVPSKEAQTQTSQPSQHSEEREPDRYFTPIRDVPQQSYPPFFNDPLRVDPLRSDPLRSLGRSDLDPFAPPGGGMLFTPPGMGPGLGRPGIDPSLPRGAVPPGARFDPFRPPGSGQPRRQDPLHPDHDHLPPPGYDDMFM